MLIIQIDNSKVEDQGDFIISKILKFRPKVVIVSKKMFDLIDAHPSFIINSAVDECSNIMPGQIPIGFIPNGPFSDINVYFDGDFTGLRCSLDGISMLKFEIIYSS